jgi:hypothetical protein
MRHYLRPFFVVIPLDKGLINGSHHLLQIHDSRTNGSQYNNN